jgi:PAS domain S-box-containing protein
MRDKLPFLILEHATPREIALQEALRQSEARYRQLVETASEGIWCIDTEGRTVSANHRMSQMLGFSIDELRAMSLFDLCSEQNRPIARANLLHRLGGNSEQYDWCFKRKDGEDVWCIVCASPTYDADGQIVGSIGLVTDITARKHAEDRVRSLSRLYAMSSSVNEAIVRVTDQQSLYEHACRIAVERGELSFSWIAIRDAPDSPLNLIAYCGGNASFVKQVMGRVNSTPTHPGPAGRALRDGVPAISNDIANDPSFFFKEPALAMQMQSCAVLPMKLGDYVQGIFAVYSKQKDYFGDEEIRVLSALADDISFAVESAAKQLALQESERMMATLFSNLPGMSYRCRNDEHWTLDVVSPGCLALTGYSPESLLGNRDISYEQVTHPLDREMVRMNVQAALNEIRPFEVLYRIVCKCGATKWVLERGTGVFDDNGELRFIEGFVTDVTARREAEEQVIQQAALLDKATDAIVLFGLDDTVHYWNRGAEKLYGWTAHEAVGKAITKLTCRDTQQRRKIVAELLEHGERVGEFSQKTKDGHDVVVDSSWTLVRDDLGKPRSILTINTDITQRKKLEAQFLTTQRLESIGTLAGGIAHDFNNILTAITGNTKLAITDIEASHPIQTHLREIEKAGLRATELVRQILTFSRKQEALRKALKLEDIVAEALRLLRATLPAQIEMHTQVENVPDIAADATQIHQVLINLGTNAAHAMGDQGGLLSVHIDTVTLDDATIANERTHGAHLALGTYVRMRVSDTGTGMDEATRERIFEPFFTTKPPGHGTGLGLSVVHGIMRSHEGSISVTSEVGRGSTFCLLFPPTTEVPVVEQIVRQQNSGGGKHILYVDDEEALVFLTTRVLERLGYRVTGRTDAKQALNDFRADPMQFDAIVSDLSMPGMTGPELARAMMGIRPDIPIVLTSGYVRDEDLKIVRELKIRDLVLKPNTVEDLGDTLHRVLTKTTVSDA